MEQSKKNNYAIIPQRTIIPNGLKSTHAKSFHLLPYPETSSMSSPYYSSQSLNLIFMCCMSPSISFVCEKNR